MLLAKASADSPTPPLAQFLENRFLSAERYVAFLVLFHQMAETVASFAPLRWDTSRSQSCLRVATTAAPISAADLLRTWQAGTAAGLDDVSHHGGAMAALDASTTPRASTLQRRQSAGALALKPGRWRASLGDIVGVLDASMRGGPASRASPPGSYLSGEGSAVSSMHRGGGALEAIAAMEAGATAFELDASQPWWSSSVVSVASGSVEPQ